MAERMITAEILKPCVLCCQPGSIVEVTETQFRCLGDAARALENDAPLPYKIVDMPTMESESEENAPDAPEIPEASLAPETPETEEFAEATENAPDAAEILEADSATETPEKKAVRGKRKRE